MTEKIIAEDIQSIAKLLKRGGFLVDLEDDKTIQVSSGDSVVKLKYANGMIHISDGEVLDRLSVLKVLTGNPSWVDVLFIAAFERATEKLIHKRDPQATVSITKKSNNKFVIKYEDQPIITIQPDASFVTISGVSNEWDNEIPTIISTIDDELPIYFWTIPVEWTVNATPIIDPDLDMIPEEVEGIDWIDYVREYIASSPTLLSIMEKLINSFFKQGGWLEQFARERGIPYQERTSQIKMAKQVLHTLLSNDKKLIVEAPTGTGKTFAYLVPVYIIAWMIRRTIESQVASGLLNSAFLQIHYRVAISTHTITLQKQIYVKDLPVIEEIFKNNLMFTLSYALAMGRNNYICLRQTDEYLSSLEKSTKGKLRGINDEVIKRRQDFVSYVRSLIEEAKLEHGLVDELMNWLGDSYHDIFFDMKEHIQSDRKNTLKDKCPFKEQCFYYNNKEKWQSANILIMNHYLLTLALGLKPAYFKTICGIIVDEGHHFPEVVRQQRGRIDFSISGIIHSVEKRMKRFHEIKDWLKGQGIPYRLKFLQGMAIIGKEVHDEYLKKLDVAEKKVSELKLIIEKISESDADQIMHSAKMLDNEGKIKNNKSSLYIPIKPIGIIEENFRFLNETDIIRIIKNLHDVLNKLKAGIQNVEHAMGNLIDVLLHGYEKVWLDLPSNEAGSLREYIKTLEESVSEFFSAYITSIKEFIDKLQDAIEVIQGFASEEDCSKYAYWIEIRRDKRSKQKRKYVIKLQKQAVFSGDLCRELITSATFPFVFTSATMTTLGSFNFFLSSAGLREFVDNIIMEKLPPAFDYESQMKILVPVDAPNVKTEPRKNLKKDDDYIEYLVNHLGRWLVASKGQALVLFTSVDMMRLVYERVKDYVYNKGIDIYIQDNGMSRDMLLKTFKQNRHSVLFATKTFWEGIDIQGDSLQLLVITRIPFPNPSDINEKALEKCFNQQEISKFMEYDLPMAGMLLQQAVGRLIRSETDSGIVIITDSRIIDERKRYSYALQRSLPVPVEPVLSQKIEQLLKKTIRRD